MTAVEKSMPRNDETRPWTQIGADLDAALAPAQKTDVPAILDGASRRYGLAPRTLQVIIKAYRFVHSNAKSVGMDVGDVKAAAMSIDILIRIQKKSPSTAMNIRKAVFAGEYSYRDMIEIERGVEKRRSSPVFEQVDWNAFAAEFVNDYFPGGELTLTFGPKRKSYSPVANLLGVDLELFHQGERACLFITPRIAFSTHRGQELEHQIPKVFASVSFFDRVIYLLWNDDEIGLVQGFLKKSRNGALRSISMLHRLEVSAYGCFGDEVLDLGSPSHLDVGT